ncbi:four helix bundle protein [Marinilabilia salmonicolor]|uniref:Four helix bundle protein n=1 Tax=Marinilabilia salmonicolor TaxID=989 RepID=A0A368UPR9_9BACT|nr:four helix bundle protein [Marinilabilia salmonicolor]RCW30030.1 four helix bundle protein [Marinilabilia salmonicolor]
MGQINSFRDLIVYQKAYAISMEIFLLTKEFPKEERYSLVDQIRRSSRSICANLSEAWAKRRYEKVFINKLTDCLGDEFETETWLNYSLDCGYLKDSTFSDLMGQYEEVRKILISMINNPQKFCK